MPKKPPSSRATEHGLLSFGLLSIPVSVYAGTTRHGIERKQFTSVPLIDPETKKQKVDDEGSPIFVDHPVGNMNYDKETGQPLLPGQEVVKKIATEYGFVHVDEHEEEALFEITPRSLAIKAFQPQHLFYQGHYVPKSLYYIEASKQEVKSKKVPNKAAQAALALLFKAMREEGAIAVVEFTTRGTPKPCVLLPNGTLWVVHHVDELREQRPLPEIPVADADVAQAKALLRMIWQDEPMELEDKRTALIQAFADEKAQAGDFGRSKAPEVVESQPEQAMDLSAILQASIAAAKQAS